MSQDTEREFLSELAGIDVHSQRQIEAAFKGLRRVSSDKTVDALIAAFEEGGLDQVLADEHLARMARHLTYWLYTGTVPQNVPDNPEEPVEGHIMSSEDYFESLFWTVIKAHPPGLSGGYYGYWHYPPEDFS